MGLSLKMLTLMSSLLRMVLVIISQLIVLRAKIESCKLKNGTLKDITRIMLIASNLYKSFWVEVVTTTFFMKACV